MDDLVLIFALIHLLASRPENNLSPVLIGSSSFVLHGEESSTRRMTEKRMQSSRSSLANICLAVQAKAERDLLLMRPILGNRVERYVFAVTNNHQHHSTLISRFNENLNQSVRQIK